MIETPSGVEGRTPVEEVLPAGRLAGGLGVTYEQELQIQLIGYDTVDEILATLSSLR